MDTSFAVEATALRKTFGAKDAVAELSFQIRPGEVVGLLGPNGAGKTTTLKILLGMLRPTSGSARLLGLDALTSSKDVKQRIGFCPDEPAFFNFLTGRETIEFALSVRGIELASAWPRIAPLVELLEFNEQLEILTNNYSHGMKKKLALLLALAHEPKVLLLDEPTNGLDPPMAHRVRELLLEQSKRGVAVLVSTHLLDMADRLCGRVLIVHHGHLLVEGTPADVRVRAGLPPEATLEDAFLKLVA